MANDQIRSQEWIDKIEGLVHRAEAITDQPARAVAVELVQAVLEFHAAGVERMLELVAGSGAAAESILEQIAKDDLTSSLLLLHNLHPDDLDTRIDRAIQKLQPMFHSLGAKLSLIAIEGDTVRLHFDSPRTWSGAPVKASVENAIFQAAPEIASVVIEGLKETPPNGFVPVSDVLKNSRKTVAVSSAPPEDSASPLLSGGAHPRPLRS